MAAGYFITFENGWTVYFAGSSAAMDRLGLGLQVTQQPLAQAVPYP